MRQNISPRHRKALAGKIGKALKQDTRVLSNEMQKILADDLVTAFFNRLDVLAHVNNNQSRRDLTVQFSNETLEMIHERSRES